MIAGTYFVSAVGLFVLALLFNNGTLGLGGFMVILCATFFFASAAASAGYLTVSEVFPLETRAMAIALFYAIATGIGGAVGPVLFGSLLGTGEKGSLFLGYGIASALMLIAAIVAWVWAWTRAGVPGGDRRAPVRDVGGARMSRHVWSPRPLAASGTDPAGLAEREVDAIVAVLRREGPLDARTLRARVEARLWGPGRFGPALRRAMSDGRVRRVGRRTWAAVE
jgi:MFS family permease